MTIIFESVNLRAKLIDGADFARSVITFSSFAKPATLDRPGFGEEFFRAEGIAAMHVVARGNRWFQYKELPALITALREHSARYERVISYGSSMGGFAALVYGADCGANLGIAISPQISLNHRDAPFETRWRGEAARIRHWYPPKKVLSEQIIAYDPHHALDSQHYEAFASRALTRSLRISHGGHPAGACLAQAGLLKRLVRDAFANRFDPHIYERILHSNRCRSSQYLYTVSRRLKPHHADLKLRLAEVALYFDKSPHIYSLVANCLAAVGRNDEAEIMHRHALDFDDGDSLVAYAIYLSKVKRYSEAMEMIDRTISKSPDSRALKLLRLKMRFLCFFRSS